MAPSQHEPVAPSQPDDELDLPNFYFEGSFDGSEFDEWKETFLADADAEAAEEAAQWGAEERFQVTRS
jgi:hypothetical protein